jgi:hypothetical protein
VRRTTCRRRIPSCSRPIAPPIRAEAKPTHKKITHAKVIVCSPGRNFVTLKIDTDAGISGIGDATLNGRELAVASYLEEHVAPCLIGRDAHRLEDTWHYLYRGAYRRRGRCRARSHARARARARGSRRPAADTAAAPRPWP